MPEPIWLSRILIDAMHAELISEHGGLYGIRDENLIESALARPRHKWHYGEADIALLAAAYGFGFAKNHGYVDGNKRIALMVIYVFLSQNGFHLDVSNAEAVRVINEVASGKITEEELAEWVRANTR